MIHCLMMISEVRRMVIQSEGLKNGGEIFIFDIQESIKIVNLAKKIVDYRDIWKVRLW